MDFLEQVLPDEQIIQDARSCLTALGVRNENLAQVQMWDSVFGREVLVDIPVDAQLTVLKKTVGQYVHAGETHPGGTALVGLGAVQDLNNTHGDWDTEQGFLFLRYNKEMRVWTEDWMLRPSFEVSLTPEDMWVLQDAETLHVTGVFTSLEAAQQTVEKHGVSGYVTWYPVNQLPYQWAQEQGFMHMVKPQHKTAQFIQNFPVRFQKRRLLKPQRTP